LEKRIGVVVMPDRQEAAQLARDARGILLETCSSDKKGTVGIGGITLTLTILAQLRTGMSRLNAYLYVSMPLSQIYVHAARPKRP
jgi:hypothetical protein